MKCYGLHPKCHVYIKKNNCRQNYFGAKLKKKKKESCICLYFETVSCIKIAGLVLCSRPKEDCERRSVSHFSFHEPETSPDHTSLSTHAPAFITKTRNIPVPSSWKSYFVKGDMHLLRGAVKFRFCNHNRVCSNTHPHTHTQ